MGALFLCPATTKVHGMLVRVPSGDMMLHMLEFAAHGSNMGPCFARAGRRPVDSHMLISKT